MRKQSSPKPGSKPDFPPAKKKKATNDKNSPFSDKATSQSEFIVGADSEDGYEEIGKWMDSDQIKSEDNIDSSYYGGDEPTEKSTIQPGMN